MECNDLVIYVINRMYSQIGSTYKDDFYVAFAKMWYYTNFGRREYHLELDVNEDFVTSCYRNADEFIDKYSSLMQSYINTYILFNSLYDIDVEVKRAFTFMYHLGIERPHEVYVLSLNPIDDISCYYHDLGKGTSFETKHGIPKINRYKPCHYSDKLFEFAIDLRRGDDLVTFGVIRKETGIPKPTLCSYAARNHITLSGGTGRNYLTPEEMERLKQIRNKPVDKPLKTGKESAHSHKTSVLSEEDMEQIKKWKDLYDSGIITEEEYAQKKKEILHL